MNILKEILKFFNAISILCVMYYIVLGLFVLKRGKKLTKNYSPTKKFAIIIPARNEEVVIENLLDSLNCQDYPKNLYDVYVLPNNCNDNTEKLSINKSAQIISCQNQIINSKGDVLRYAFNYLKNKDYDAFIVFDADNIVHPNFIQKMNNILIDGYKLAQGYRDSKNPTDSWISSCYSLHYMIQNVFINKARMNIKKSSFINGTGFMVSKEILENDEYLFKTVTEDIELSVKCALNNQKIAFVEEAITYDEQPIKFMESWKQRKRWSKGTFQCLKLYIISLLKDIIKNKKFSSLDSIMFLTAPIIQLVGTLSFIIHIFVEIIEKHEFNIIYKISYIIIWYIVTICLELFLIKINKKKAGTYIKGIVTLPLFYFSWIPINCIALIKKNYKWEKIEHTRIVKLDTIFKLKCISNNRVNNQD